MQHRHEPSGWVVPGLPRAVFALSCALAVSLGAEAAPAATPTPERTTPSGGATVNEGKLERLAGQGYRSSPGACSGVDLVVKKIKMRRSGTSSVAVSATLSNLCTGAATVETHWAVETPSDPAGGVLQSIGTPGAGPWTWDTGTLIVPGEPRNRAVVVTVRVDPRSTGRERNDGNNSCRATLPANTDSRDATCPY
jgi:hypothetical protein